MPVAIVALALAAFAATGPQSPTPAEEALVARFVAALEQGSLAAFAPLSSKPVGGDAWTSVRDTLERFHAIKVTGYQTMSAPGGESRMIGLKLEAWGIANNARQDRRPLPETWILGIEAGSGGPNVSGAMTAELAIARELYAASDDSHRHEILWRHGGDLDRRALLSAAIDEAAAAPRDGPRGAQVDATVAFVRDEAATSGDLALVSRAVSMMTYFSPAALAGQQSALALATESGDHDAIASAQMRLATVLARTRDAGASTAFQRLMASIDTLDDPRIAMKGLQNASVIAFNNGDLSEAMVTADQLVANAKRFGWVEGEAMAHWTLAEIHSILGQHGLAAQRYEEVISGLRAAGNLKLAARALGDLATAELRAGSFERGSTHVREAIAAVHGGDESDAWLGPLIVSPVDGMLAAGRVAEAANLVEEASHRRPPGKTHGFAEVAFAAAKVRLAEGKPEDALRVLRESDSFDPGWENWQWKEWQAFLLRGRALLQLDRVADAEAQLRLAVAAIESHRASVPTSGVGRAAFMEDKLAPYRELLELLVGQGRPAEAFSVAERMRAQSLQQALEQGQVDPSPTLTASEKQQEQELDDRVAQLNRQLRARDEPLAQQRLKEARQDLEQFRAELYLRHPEEAARRVPDLDPAVAAREALPPGATALEFVVLEGKTLVFAVERSEADVAVTVHAVPLSRSELRRRVDGVLDAVAHRDLTWAAEAEALDRLLLEPIVSRLAPASPLVVVPDDALWRLPFQVLRSPAGRHLADRVILSYAPSLSILALQERSGERQDQGRSLLAIADPVVGDGAGSSVRAMYRGASLGSLPDADREARAISKLYFGAELYSGAAATESVFKQRAGGFRVLHLATHGILDDRAPMYSALVLAADPGSGQDGLLEAREIVDLRLGARLAVLSACETARGRIAAGEGMIGLSWAFQAAGVPTLVVSGWKTDSAATAALMIAFHRELLAGASAAEALRHAERELRRDRRYSHPFYWAPFVVVGAGD